MVGSGLAGICAAVGAARGGATVSLIESRLTLGGRVGKEFLFPFDFGCTSNFVYQRETGILDEILFAVFRENVEGNYCGQERGLFNWLKKEKRVNLFLGAQLFDVSLNDREDRINSVAAFSNSTGEKLLFKASYFIDCSGIGFLGQLAKAPGEKGVDIREYEKSSSSGKSFQFRTATSVEIELSDKDAPFCCPDWVSIKWEDNHPSAQIDLMESLSKEIEGVHSLEWLGNTKDETSINSSHLVWCAWDYLKNRSPLRDRARGWIVRDFSPLSFCSDGYRSEGDYQLVPDDLESSASFYDSVALGRGPLDMTDSLLFSPRGKVALTRPFEIPLRCLISRRVKNLLLTGPQSSVSSRALASLSHPATAAQTGEAIGVCAAYCLSQNRLPKTVAKEGNVEGLQRKLNRLNHSFRLGAVEDLQNLIPLSNVISSTELTSSFSESQLDEKFTTFRRGLIQFSVDSDEVKDVLILLKADKDVELKFRFLEGAYGGNTIPGTCLHASSVFIRSGKIRWEVFSIGAKIERQGWHFLELVDADGVSFFQQKNSPVGSLLYLPLDEFKTGLINPFSQYYPVIPKSPELSKGIAFQITPEQKIYSAKNVQNGKTRPDHLPNLWISEETDFRFPEFLEFHWEEPVDISSIEIVWDSTLEYLFPNRPQKTTSTTMPSIVKDYKIYYTNKDGHWIEFISVSGNKLGFNCHSFENINTRAIEIEISKTNGLNRAQVYEVRAYS